MGPWAKYILIGCLIFTGVELLIGCTSDDNHQSGTSDSGGGNALPSRQGSRPEDIRTTINYLVVNDQWAIGPDHQLTGFSQDAKRLLRFIVDQELKDALTYMIEPTALYTRPWMHTQRQIMGNRFTDLWYVSGPRTVIIQNPPCIEFHGGPADASVTRMDSRGSVCFSIDRLSQVPGDALAAQIRALFTHESCHLLGYGESTCKKVQAFTLRFIEGYFAGDTPLFPTRSELIGISSYMDSLYRLLDNLKNALANQRGPYSVNLIPGYPVQTDVWFLLGHLLPHGEDNMNKLNHTPDLKAFHDHLIAYYQSWAQETATPQDVDALMVELDQIAARIYDEFAIRNLEIPPN